MKFSDKKKDYFSKKDVETYIERQNYFWEDYDEYDKYIENMYPDDNDYVYLDIDNYIKYTVPEKRYHRKILFNYTQVDINSFTSLKKQREIKIKQLFGEYKPFEKPTFGDLIGDLTNLKKDYEY